MAAMESKYVSLPDGLGYEMKPRSSIMIRSMSQYTNGVLDESKAAILDDPVPVTSAHGDDIEHGAGSDDDNDGPSYMSSPAGDEYDRNGQADRDAAAAASRSAPRVSHSWRYPTILLFIYTVGMLIIFFISEFSVESVGNFCGPSGFVAIHDGFISHCLREAVMSLPNCLLMLTYFIIWLFGSPWLLKETAKRPWDKFSGAKFAVLFLATLMPFSRLLTRAIEVTFTRPDDPAVFGAMDVVQLIMWILCTVIVYHDWKYGIGHRMYIRYFWWVATIDSFVKVYAVVDLVVSHGTWDWTDAMYMVSFACNVILSIMATLGWRDGTYELFGGNHRASVKRRGFPPFKQVWALMKQDTFLLSIGFLLSGGQGVLLSLALTATAGLMGGDTETKEDATDQLAVFLFYSFAVAISTMIQQAIFGITGQRVKRRMKNLMFKNFLLQDTTFLKRKENDTGRLTSRLLSDTERFGTSVTTQLSAVMRPLSQAVIGTGFLFSISWRLTAVVLMMAIILMIISVLRSSLITVKYSRLYSDQLAGVSSRGVEVIKGIECVHQYQQEKNEHTSFVNSLDRVYNVGVGKETRESIFEGLEHLMLATILGTGLWYGSILQIEDLLSKDELIAFALITGAVVTSIEGIMKIVPEFLDVSGPALRVCELINSKVTWDFDQLEKGAEPSKLDGAITFDNVTFLYPGAPKKTLGPGLSFQVKGGESCALVGESGCGKSTCISLVQRQYHVKGLVDGCKKLDVGRITVDGHDIRELNRRWVLDRIGVVAQRAIMWNTTILENVAYGQPSERWYKDTVDDLDAQRERVIRALDMAAAWNEFVNPNPPLRVDGTKPPGGLGLYFQVGEDGCNLSGGQKQRISIARMIYKNPSLFIFDEVTSALDAGSEKNVMRTLIDISQNPVKKSCLMIAHRLNTIKHADHVIVLSKAGNIMEETWTRMENANGEPILGADGQIITPLSKPASMAAATSAVDGSRLVTAHEQLLRNTTGYYRRMWDDQTF